MQLIVWIISRMSSFWPRFLLNMLDITNLSRQQQLLHYGCADGDCDNLAMQLLPQKHSTFHTLA